MKSWAMPLASLTFLTVLVLAHSAGDLAENLGLPLSLFRDGDRRVFGLVLFGLLLAVALLMVVASVEAGRPGDALLFSAAGCLLLVVAVTPSQQAFHLVCSLVLLTLLYASYAALLRRIGLTWVCVHLAVPALLLLATRCHSYGLWQKGLIVYFLLTANVHYFVLARNRTAPRSQGGWQLRRRVIYVAAPGRGWSRRQS